MNDINPKIFSQKKHRYQLRKSDKKNYDEEKFADSFEDEGLIIINIVIYEL